MNQMIRDYILENPEIIPEAVNILQQRRQKQAEQEAERALKDNRQALLEPGRCRCWATRTATSR
ncbi:MAG: hypothetical protein U5L08_06450 [Xanthomonadales bacterium]|nr:hypothetical protein [Xanthomonadales bacterium]